MPKLIEGIAARIRVPDGARDILIFDDTLPGFFIRKFASGRASYGVKFSVGTQQRRLSLGAVVPGVLAERRRMAADILARARLGQDMVGEKRTAAGKQVITLGMVVPKYLAARKGELRPKSFIETQRYLERTWLPLHAQHISAITRQHIVSIIDDAEVQSGKVAADRARVALSGLFGWAIDRGYLDANPTLNIRARAQSGARERVLSEAELAAVWSACDGDDDFGRIVRLLILTGQRRAEIGDLSWPEIVLERQQIELSEVRTKNGRGHVVPLSTEALEVLHAMPRRPDRALVFGTGVGGFSGWSKAKGELDLKLASTSGVKPMAAWTLHDIRRSVVTHLHERGFAPPHVVEAIVNHISGHQGGVAGVYNKAQYLPERRQALALWGAHVAALVEGRANNIVLMRA